MAGASGTSVCGEGSFDWKTIYTCFLLLLVNLLNFIDRFAIAPLLSDIADYYSKSYADVGFLMTVFLITYLVCSPIFGYLGDRYSRKLLLALGIAVWSIAVLGSTFVPANAYWLFVVLRAVVGVGEASYGTISPTLLADMFVGNTRSRMLTLFFLGIPVGYGLGNVIGPNLAKALGSWQWGLRVTPLIGMVASVGFFFAFDPPRGMAEGKEDKLKTRQATFGGYLKESFNVAKIKTYLLTSIGATAVTFATGSFGWWATTYLVYAQHSLLDFSYTNADAGSAFGTLSVVGGLLGTVAGSFVAQFLRPKTRKADCIVCGLSLILGSICMFLSILLAGVNVRLAYAAMFFECIFVCCNYSVGPDILLQVIGPDQRSLANGLQNLIAHVLGDAISPFIVGKIADGLHKGSFSNDYNYFIAFRSALLLLPFICLLAGGTYLVASFFVERDLERCRAIPEPV